MPSSPAQETNQADNKIGKDDAGDNSSKSSQDGESDSETTGVTGTSYEELMTEEELPPSASSGDTPLPALQPARDAAADTTHATGARGELPADWSDQGCLPHNGPVMTHTRIYHGNDGDFTEALANYYHFRNDARFGGWQNYLQRSDDFIRFCCHVHIAEMLSARGGGDPTRVVWRWSDCR
jgi:hypothetical protein